MDSGLHVLVRGSILCSCALPNGRRESRAEDSWRSIRVSGAWYDLRDILLITTGSWLTVLGHTSLLCKVHEEVVTSNSFKVLALKYLSASQSH